MNQNKSAWLNTAPFCLAVAWPLMSMLFHHGYPLASPELAILTCLILLLGFLLSLPGRLGFQKTSNVILVLVLSAAAILQFNLMPMSVALLAGFLLIVASLVRKNFDTLVVVVCTALILGAWLDAMIPERSPVINEGTATANEQRGSVVHLLLDGFTGIDGLLAMPESRAFSIELMTFLHQNGFAVHTRAYSHYLSTVDSMTRAFNFRNDHENLFRKAAINGETMSFRNNSWFEQLHHAGYPIFIYQSEAMDFCDVQSRGQRFCREFTHPALNTINSDISNSLLRSDILIRNLLDQSRLIKGALTKLRVHKSWGVSIYRDEMRTQLMDDLRAYPGSAFFAHFLLPHSPFVRREDCSLNYKGGMSDRFTHSIQGTTDNERLHAARYRRLVPQMRCAMNIVENIIQTLKATGQFENSTIIIHGDHGAKLSMVRPRANNPAQLADRMKQLSFQDLRENYSLLFAVKSPKGVFSVDDTTTPLNVLLLQQAASLTGKDASELSQFTEDESSPFIYMSGKSSLFKAEVDIYSDMKRATEPSPSPPDSSPAASAPAVEP